MDLVLALSSFMKRKVAYCQVAWEHWGQCLGTWFITGRIFQLPLKC